MERQRVLLTNFHLGTGGGHRTYILALLQSELARTYDFALACPPSSPINIQARRDGQRVFDLHFPGTIGTFFRIISTVRELERIHHRFPFEIIHCNGSRDHWIALYWKTLFRRKSRIVRTRHAVKSIRPDFLHDWAYNHATALNIYVSELMVALAEPAGKLKLNNAVVIPNGVDTDHFSPRPKDRELAFKFGLSESDLVIGTNAGLGSHKRTDLMLQAVAASPVREKLKVFLMGEERSAPHYLQMAEKLGLAGQVVFGGMQTDVRPYLSLFDLGFVLSEKIETSSFAAKEMMSMGIPLICTRYSGLPENIDEGKNGFLIQPGNLGDLQKCLSSFLELPAAKRAEMGAYSRQKVMRQFSRSAQLESIRRAYERVLA